MSAYANAGGVLTHSDALILLAETKLLRDFLLEIDRNPRSWIKGEIKQKLDAPASSCTLTETDIAALCGGTNALKRVRR